MINKREDIFDKVQAILQEMGEPNAFFDRPEMSNAEIDKIRLAIISLLKEAVNFYGTHKMLGLWEKDFLRRAISVLYWNLSSQKSSMVWLKPCLHRIKKTALPIEQRPRAYLKDEEEVRAINDLDEIGLINAIDMLEANYIKANKDD